MYHINIQQTTNRSFVTKERCHQRVYILSIRATLTLTDLNIAYKRNQSLKVFQRITDNIHILVFFFDLVLKNVSLVKKK